jgi:hypothetical protein
MGKAFQTPITNEDGEVRDLTDEEWLWAVRDEDFGGVFGSVAFLENRSKVLRDAEAQGFDRSLFLAFEPNKPGFEERAERAMQAFKDSAKHAAE